MQLKWINYKLIHMSVFQESTIWTSLSDELVTITIARSLVSPSLRKLIACNSQSNQSPRQAVWVFLCMCMCGSITAHEILQHTFRWSLLFAHSSSWVVFSERWRQTLDCILIWCHPRSGCVGPHLPFTSHHSLFARWGFTFPLCDCLLFKQCEHAWLQLLVACCCQSG